MAEHAHIKALSDLQKGARIYFIGIGGISMGGLAIMAARLGFHVAGSDPHESERTRKLSAQGIIVHTQHHPDWIDDFAPDLIVYTAAIPYWNVELSRARDLGIRCVDRSVFLGWLTRSYDHVINVAGTHGKTTTTAMISTILIQARRNPTVHLGAEFADFDHSTVRTGTPGDLLISEACEYKNSLLNFHSTTAVLLNIDRDHMDFFPDMDALIDTFAQFAAELPAGGHFIYPFSGPYIQDCLLKIKALREGERSGSIRALSFGLIDDSWNDKDLPAACAAHQIPDYAAKDLHFVDGHPHFNVYRKGQFYTSIQLSVPGEHNVLNALAALAASDLNGATPQDCQEGLSHFKGTEGRFTVRGTFQGATVVCDYAHHPTSTRVTLEAAKKMTQGHIWVVYQPLTFSRVKVLFQEYVDALKDCEQVLFYEIFSDRESDSLGMSSRQLVQAINACGGHALFMETFADIYAQLKTLAGPGDIILFLGPEQVRSFAAKLLE